MLKVSTVFTYLLVSACLCVALACGSTTKTTAYQGQGNGAPSTGGGPVGKAPLGVFLPRFPSPNYWLLNPDGTGTPMVSAHRGRPELDEYPENCLESLQRLMAEGSFIAEIDINISKDGVLFLFHDDDLERLTRSRGRAADRNWSELDTMRLRDAKGRLTNYTIPSLDEALVLAKGKGLLSLDRKKPVTLRQLNDAAKAKGMLNQVSLILYDFEDYKEWAQLPELGPISHEALDLLQVEELAQRNRELYARFGTSPFRENGTRPTSGFLGVGQPNPKMLATAKTLSIRSTVGTFGALDERAIADNGKTYRDLIKAGVSVLATNRPLAASRAIYGTGVRP